MDTRKDHLLIPAVLLIALAMGCSQGPTVTLRRFEVDLEQTLSCPYRIQLPAGWEPDDPPGTYPVLFYVHGAYVMDPSVNQAERIEKLASIGPDLNLLSQKYDFIVVSPMTPDAGHWINRNVEIGMHLLEEILTNYGGDRDRVYITGPSAGGTACWAFTIAHPETFAAALPLMGSVPSYSRGRKVLSRLPIWAFSAGDDTLCPPSNVRTMVQAVRGAGGKVRFDVLPDTGHGGWHKIWARAESYDWLLSHQRKQGVANPGPRIVPAPPRTPPKLPTGQYIKQTFSRTNRRKIDLPYLELLPAGYGSTRNIHPLIVYLHGAMAAGEGDPSAQQGPIAWARQHAESDFIILAPQFTGRNRWNYDMTEQVVRFMDWAVTEYHVDPRRITLTGWGMGGHGAWVVADILARRFGPGRTRLAAVVPISAGQIDPRGPNGPLRHQAWWIFHGEQDNVVDPIEAKNMAGQWTSDRQKFTLFEGVGHDAWKRAYRHEQLYEWMARQREMRVYSTPEVLAEQKRHVMPDRIHAAGPVEQLSDADLRALTAGGNRPNVGQYKVRKLHKIRGRYNQMLGYTLLPGFNQRVGQYVIPLEIQAGQGGQILEVYMAQQGEDDPPRLAVGGRLAAVQRRTGQAVESWEQQLYGSYWKLSARLNEGVNRAAMVIGIVGNGVFTFRVSPHNGDVDVDSPAPQ